MTFEQAEARLRFDVEGMSEAALRQMCLHVGLDTNNVIHHEEVRNVPCSEEAYYFILHIHDDLDYFAETAVWLHGWYCLPSPVKNVTEPLDRLSDALEALGADGGEVYEGGDIDGDDIPF